MTDEESVEEIVIAILYPGYAAKAPAPQSSGDFITGYKDFKRDFKKKRDEGSVFKSR